MEQSETAREVVFRSVASDALARTLLIGQRWQVGIRVIRPGCRKVRPELSCRTRMRSPTLVTPIFPLDLRPRIGASHLRRITQTPRFVNGFGDLCQRPFLWGAAKAPGASPLLSGKCPKGRGRRTVFSTCLGAKVWILVWPWALAAMDARRVAFRRGGSIVAAAATADAAARHL